MRHLLTGLLLAFPLALAAAESPAEPRGLTILTYHEVRQDILEDPYNMTVTLERLAGHFDWLKARDYKVIGVEDMLRAARGEQPLPDKAVMITFDDCYRTHYTQVFPLLKAFDYPAVMACVGSWMDAPEDAMVKYGDEDVPRANFLTREQIREMAASGLVEFASHSYNLHNAVLANPQGNKQSSADTMKLDPKKGSYESEEEHRARVKEDLARSAKYLESLTGRKPRLLVWPYGAYNQPGIDAAREAGMPVTFTLDEHYGPAPLTLERLGRLLVLNNPRVEDLAWELRPADRIFARMMQVDLDYVYDPDPVQQEANLDQLVERALAMGVNTVYLQAFADPDGDGNADALYFPNRHLPMRADLLNRVLWQLQTRAGVHDILGWLPVSAYSFPEGHPAAEAWVEAEGGLRGPGSGMKRLSIFNPEVRRAVGEIYEDMARHVPVDGVLFHDDAILGDNEDMSQAARSAYRAAGLPDTLDDLHADAATYDRWTTFKTRALIDWTQELMSRVRIWRPYAISARNLFALPVLDPETRSWFSQSLPDFVAAYDQVALMAMPYMEGAEDPEAWMDQLVDEVRKVPGAIHKTVFELQSVDWRTGEPIDSMLLARQFHRLQRQGVLNLGYYPDDFVNDHPEHQDVAPALSARTTPH